MTECDTRSLSGSRGAIDAAVEAIRESPLRFPIVVTGDVEACTAYPQDNFRAPRDQIVVIACFNDKRNPKRWQAR